VKTTDDAFMPTHERPQFFASSVMTTVLTQLQQGLQHSQPIMVVTGDAGVGKTFVMREACTRWGARMTSAWVDARDCDAERLLATIMTAFGIARPDTDADNDHCETFARTIAAWSAPAMLVIDRADALTTDALVELAHLVNAVREERTTLRVTLVGRSTLEMRLADPALQTVAARIGVRCTVPPMPIADVRPYLQHRINAEGGDASGVFSRKSSRELHLVTNGITGHLDAVAAESIRVARAAGVTQVTPEQVRRAAERTTWPQDGLDAAPRVHATVSRKTPKVTAASEPPTPVAPAPVTPIASPAAANTPQGDTRVSEWVARFTDGQGAVRFGARQTTPVPMTTPDALPTFSPKRASSIMSRRVVTALRTGTPAPTLMPTNHTPTPTPNVTPTPVAPIVDVTPTPATPNAPTTVPTVNTPVNMPVTTASTDTVTPTTTSSSKRDRRSRREQRRAQQRAEAAAQATAVTPTDVTPVEALWRSRPRRPPPSSRRAWPRPAPRAPSGTGAAPCARRAIHA
jgi:type II secretory pathway predicted ATPase ExeA